DEILNASKFMNETSLGAIGSFAQAIRGYQPQCFEISEDVVDACSSVFRSRPSSVLSALNYARLPYPAIWIERVFVPQHGPNVPNADKPPPKRVGCLVTDISPPNAPRLSSALACWAWCFPANQDPLLGNEVPIHIAPFAVMFDWHQPIRNEKGL